jgi:hypothetical protein
MKAITKQILEKLETYELGVDLFDAGTVQEQGVEYPYSELYLIKEGDEWYLFTQTTHRTEEVIDDSINYSYDYTYDCREAYEQEIEEALSN